MYLDSSVWLAWINGDHDVRVVRRVMEWAQEVYVCRPYLVGQPDLFTGDG